MRKPEDTSDGNQKIPMVETRRYQWGNQKIPMGKPQDTNGETRRYKWWKPEDTNGGNQKMPMVETRSHISKD